MQLLGLCELMVNGDEKRIREYKAIWRRNHRIPEGMPSTLYDPAWDSRRLAAAARMKSAA